MAWSEEQFRARVVERAAELGRSVRSVLLEAGVALDILDKVPTSGRRVDTLEKIARALGWSLSQMMGFDDVARVTGEIMDQVLAITRRILRHHTDADEAEGTVSAMVLNAIQDYRRDGHLLDARAGAMLEAAIAAAWDAAAYPRSAPPSPPDASAATATAPGRRPRRRSKPQ